MLTLRDNQSHPIVALFDENVAAAQGAASFQGRRQYRFARDAPEGKQPT